MELLRSVAVHKPSHVYPCIRSSNYIFARAKGFYITVMSCSWKGRLKNQSLKLVQTGESSHQLLSCFHQFYGIRAGSKHKELSLPRCSATCITGMFLAIVRQNILLLGIIRNKHVFRWIRLEYSSMQIASFNEMFFIYNYTIRSCVPIVTFCCKLESLRYSGKSKDMIHDEKKVVNI